jgi:trimeric autotransporter adhesin
MSFFAVIASSGKKVPGAPTIGTATDVGTARAYNNGAATVTFTAPTYTGGIPITSYLVTSSPGGFTGTAASSPVTVTGLQSNTAYTFTVQAINAVGTGASSAPSNSITATTVPEAPTIGTPTLASGQPYTGSANIGVVFTSGATGGSAITGFTATSSSANTGSGVSSPVSVTDLVAVARTYTVTATNANGTSTASSASSSITPLSVPQAPTIGTASNSGATGASVTFTASANNGGASISTYTATSSPGSISGSNPTSPITVSGLTTNTTYSFTVYATNSQGNSALSAASNNIVTGTATTSIAYLLINGGLNGVTPTSPSGASGGNGGNGYEQSTYAVSTPTYTVTCGVSNGGTSSFNGQTSFTTSYSGGGGGAPGATGSPGGAGFASSVSGVSTTYGGGGGGGQNATSGTPTPTRAAGGAGGGGSGGSGNQFAGGGTNGAPGTDGLGGGGGGGGSDFTFGAGPGGAGGIGGVVIAYSTSSRPAVTTGNVTYTVNGSTRSYSFFGSGTIKF